MTPGEWSSCDSLYWFMAVLSPFEDQRRARLLIAGCGLPLWDRLTDETRAVVRIGERAADGQATPDEIAWATVRAEAWRISAFSGTLQSGREQALQDWYERLPPGERARARDREWERTTLGTLVRSLVPGDSRVDDVLRALLRLSRHDAVELLRCVYRQPGSPGLEPAWRTSTAVGLARTMYESRDFAAMPILADALEEAGCDSPDVLAHCRADTPHVRGCWVVDLVLGKA